MAIEPHKPPFLWLAETQPERNRFVYFRHEILAESGAELTLSVTAASYYILFVNGVRVGNGPARHYPDYIPYDTYSLSHLLRPGKNVIGALIHTIGNATMQAPYESPYFWAAFADASGITDHAPDVWMTKPCMAMDASAPRISVQQAYTEHTDYRLLENFSSPEYMQDAQWHMAVEILKEGCQLYPRDIPLLTDQPQSAVCAHTFCRVKPPRQSFVVDVRDLLLKETDAESNHNCDPAHLTGLLATVLTLDRPQNVTLCLDIARFRPFWLDGQYYTSEDVTGSPLLQLTQWLEKGDHLLIFDLCRREHWDGVHFAATWEGEGKFYAPLNPTDPVPFTLLGHFSKPIYDPDGSLPVPAVPATLLQAVTDLQNGCYDAVRPYQIAIPVDFCALRDPLLDFTFATECEKPAPNSTLQNCVNCDNTATRLDLLRNEQISLTVDFGEQRVGYLELEMDAPAGTEVSIYSYEFEENGVVQHTWGLDSVWKLIWAGGRQKVTSFLRRGLRYSCIRLSGEGKAQIYHLGIREATFPMPKLGSFACSDGLLTDLWEMSARTVRLCTEDTFVDCSAYEQVFWVGDSRNESLVGRYIYGTALPTRRCLELTAKSLDQCELGCSHLPSGWSNVIPNWSFFWIIACGEYAAYTGSGAFISTILPAVCRCLDAFIRHLDKRGLLDIQAWNLLDWAPTEQPNDGIVAHQNMFLVKALHTAIRLLQTTGHVQKPEQTQQINRSEKAASYQTVADKLTAAIEQYLWCDEKKAYYDCIYPDGHYSTTFSMQTQICAILAKIPSTAERQKDTQAHIICPPPDFVQICSPFMSFFHYEVLEEMGRISQMTQDMKQHYGFMLRHGATTCWEQYVESPLNKVYQGMYSRSHCHAWSAAPAYFLARNILGFRPSKDWSSLVIAPKPGDVTWARGTLPLPDGSQVDFSYEVEGKQLLLQIQAPAWLPVQVCLPNGYVGQFAANTRLGDMQVKFADDAERRIFDETETLVSVYCLSAGGVSGGQCGADRMQSAENPL